MFWMRNGKIEEERPKPTPKCPKGNSTGAVCAWEHEGKLYKSPELRDLAIKAARKRETVEKMYAHLHYKYGIGSRGYGGETAINPKVLITMMYDEGMIKTKD